MNLYQYHTNPETLLGYDSGIMLEIPKNHLNEYTYTLLDLIKDDDWEGLWYMLDEMHGDERWINEVSEWSEFTDYLRGIVHDFNFGKYIGYYPNMIAQSLMQQRNTNTTFNNFDFFDLSDIVYTIFSGEQEESDVAEEKWYAMKDELIAYVKGGIVE